MLLPSSIAGYDHQLVPIAACIAMAAAYATLIVLDHISYATSWRRFAWSCTAALTSALGIWSMQCIMTISLNKNSFLRYDFQTEAAALAVAIVFSLIAAIITNTQRWGIRRVAAGGIMFGVAIIGSHVLGVRAMHLNGRDLHSGNMDIAAMLISIASALVALLIGSRFQRTRNFTQPLLRFGAAMLMAGGSIVSYLYLLVGIQVLNMNPANGGTPSHLPIALAVAGATAVIILGAVAAVSIDVHASTEHERAHRFSDLYRRERQVSTTLQRALLPTRLPVVAGVSFSSVYLPHSKEAYVGGDWYDAFMLADGRIAFSMGDVSGHGLSAALTMNVVRHALRACADEQTSPSLVLARTNRILLRSDHPAIVTAVFAIFDPETLGLSFAVAGHPPPLVMASHGIALARAQADPPLGVLDELTYRDNAVTVPPGGMIAFYTDGCTEFDRDLIKGERRFAEVCAEVLIRGEARPANAIADRLFAKRALNDDAAIFCVQIDRDVTRVLRRLIDTVKGEESARSDSAKPPLT